MAVQKSTTGMGITTEAALSYVFGAVTGVIFLVLSKDKFVRFHAMQSIVFTVAVVLVNMVLGFFTLGLVLPILGIAEFVLWLLLIYKSWQGEEYELPVIGKFAKQFIGRM